MNEDAGLFVMIVGLILLAAYLLTPPEPPDWMSRA